MKKILITLFISLLFSGCSLTITISKPKREDKTEKEDNHSPAGSDVMTDRWGNYYSIPRDFF